MEETLETLNLETPSHDESLRDKRTIGFLRNLFPGISEEPNLEDNLAGSESRVNEVRVPYDGDAALLDEEDQETAATGDEESVARSEDSVETDNEPAASDTGDRDKRFLFFGGGDSSSGSAGGSGNFLFDIIRLITGSGSSDSSSDSDGSSNDGVSAGLTASVAVGKDGGAAAGAAAGTPSLDPNDGYTSGIPGPLTRLFIIANRGISNLLQDLILRLSQTSERIVNFKARLITALI
ncbi:hypothetical protein J437_LFUL001484 [Ladona fulva]|uniref:Uncharacterized protein n=1 Tax=Ladona fulva TaxID=123851 RepID=A0A8K0JWN1_LADFU|nr:hypothetical protein J437_LFUL001484 [Ladona fulva]